jgi:hypothetical protein
MSQKKVVVNFKDVKVVVPCAPLVENERVTVRSVIQRTKDRFVNVGTPVPEVSDL